MAHPACGKKLTDRVNFGMALDKIPESLGPIVHDCTRKRQGIEEALKQVDGCSETVVNTLKEYVVINSTLKSILQKVKSFSRLRFKWSNLMDDDEKTVTNNVDEDMASMIMAAGMWHLEHAHFVNKSITSEDEDEEKMKQSLNSLKTAASIFETAKTWAGLVQGSKDLSVPIVSALHLQSVAEGQSVTIRRAVSKNHKASLISELCHDVSQKYTTAAGEIDTSHHEGQKWSTYLKFQGESYMALARCYQGCHLLEAEEKCGESIVVLNEGFKHLDQATHLAKEYDKIKPKTKLHLAESAPFERIKKLLDEKKAKSDRENNLIYHQRLPEESLPPPDPKCVVHVTALELQTGEDLTRNATENSDEKQPEGEGEEGATDAGTS
ncbi:BRO1 domain-containing protein BROX-like [Oculina patagonica]